jgi:hypothetical protein
MWFPDPSDRPLPLGGARQGGKLVDNFERYFPFSDSARTPDEICDAVCDPLAAMNWNWDSVRARSRFAAGQKFVHRLGGGDDLQGPSTGAAARLAGVSDGQDHAIPAAHAPASSLGTAPPPSGFPVDSRCRICGFARADTHGGFRALMSKDRAALSLINTVLHAAIDGFVTITGFRRLDPALPLGDGDEGHLDFHAEADSRRRVVIDMLGRDEIPVEELAYFPKTWPQKPRDGGDETESKEWTSALHHLYYIQFLNCNSESALPQAERDSYFTVLDQTTLQVVSVDAIRIELPRIGMRFPVADEVALGWRDQSAVNWWYYMLSFSDLFTNAEVKRCQDLGMPADVIGGLGCLAPVFWTNEQREEYLRELGIDPLVQFLGMRR